MNPFESQATLSECPPPIQGQQVPLNKGGQRFRRNHAGVVLHRTYESSKDSPQGLRPLPPLLRGICSAAHCVSLSRMHASTFKCPLALEPKICYFYMTSNQFLGALHRLCPS